MTRDNFLMMLYAGGAPRDLIEETEIYLNLGERKFKEDAAKEYEHTIIFIPVCGKCGSPIVDPVNYIKEGPGFYGGVEPSLCKKCRTYFNQIVMPGQFPFEGYFV